MVSAAPRLCYATLCGFLTRPTIAVPSGAHFAKAQTPVMGVVPSRLVVWQTAMSGFSRVSMERNEGSLRLEARGGECYECPKHACNIKN